MLCVGVKLLFRLSQSFLINFYLVLLIILGKDNNCNSDLHPDDPKNVMPLNQIEFKQRVIRGPYQPALNLYPRSNFSGVQRSFQKSWFELFTWLEYSPKFDLAFCFPCRMFNNSNGINIGQTDKAYSKTGYKNWKAATIKFKAHQMSKVHLNCVTSLTNLLQSKPIDVLLDEERENTRSEKEKQRLLNRKIIQRLIDVTLCLGIGGKPFRGHSEKKDDVNRGLFLGIVDLLKKYDPILKKHFESGPKNSIYCSNYIQNDLIASVGIVIKRQLKDILKNEKVSLMADETSDVGHHEQLSVVVRYFDKSKNKPIEQFVCMKRMMSVDAQSVFNVLTEVVEEYEIKWENVISTCFDGAATMAGSITGVQTKFKEKNPKCFFVHCYGHCLNLILVDSIGKNNTVPFNFLGCIQMIYNFIEGSCIRHAVLENVSRSINTKLKTLKSLSTTRWACRSEAVNAVKNNYSALLIAIKQITDSTKQSDIRAKGLGIIYQMESFEFIFAMQMLDPILNLILHVSTVLQSSNMNLLTAIDLVKSLKKSLQFMRNDENEFENIYKSTKQLCEENGISIPNIKKRKVSSKIDMANNQYFMPNKKYEMKVNVYYQTLDQLITGLDLRFNQETLEMMKSMAHLLKLETDSEDVVLLSSIFDLDASNLENEIRLLKQSTDFSEIKKENCEKWINWLTMSDTGRNVIFCNIFKAIKQFMVIPVTTCSCERSFSKLSIIKIKLRSTMLQERLDHLLTMFIEQELAYNVNLDEVIDTFKTLRPAIERRMEL